MLEGLEVKGAGFFDIEPVCCGFVEGFSDSSGVPGDLFGHTAEMLSVICLWIEFPVSPYPTLTHVPPSLLLSTAIVFAPHCPLALLAQASPPLPPPMTRKSHSLLMGAMIADEAEKWREKAASLGTAGADTLWPRARNRRVGDSLTVIRNL